MAMLQPFLQQMVALTNQNIALQGQPQGGGGALRALHALGVAPASSSAPALSPDLPAVPAALTLRGEAESDESQSQALHIESLPNSPACISPAASPVKEHTPIHSRPAGDSSQRESPEPSSATKEPSATKGEPAKPSSLVSKLVDDYMQMELRLKRVGSAKKDVEPPRPPQHGGSSSSSSNLQMLAPLAPPVPEQPHFGFGFRAHCDGGPFNEPSGQACPNGIGARNHWDGWLFRESLGEA